MIALKPCGTFRIITYYYASQLTLAIYDDIGLMVAFSLLTTLLIYQYSII